MSRYGDLRAKYGDFAAPAYKIKIGGRELGGFLIDDICVDNSVGSASGACRFSVFQAYEFGSRQFSAPVLEALKPGGQISVSLGYGSGFGEVFTGYIDELGMRFDGENIRLDAVCLDARALMRDGAYYHAAHGKTIAAVADGILARYAPLITKRSLTLPELETGVNLTRAGSDLEYIVNAAGLRGKYFFIECGSAVIGGAEDTVCVEFDWPECEMEFGARYLERKITGTGYDCMDAGMEGFSEEQEAKGKNQKSLLTVTQTMHLPPHLLGDAGKSIVAAAVKTAERETIRGTVSCRGIPEPKLGRKLKINAFPLALFGGGSFTVISIRHRMRALTDGTLEGDRFGRIEEGTRLYLRYDEPEETPGWRGAETMEQILERGGKTRLHLARIHMTRWGDAYEINEIDPLPFGQTAGMRPPPETPPAAPPPEPPPAADRARPDGPPPARAFGTATVCIPDGARFGSVYTSEEVFHGLGLTDVYITLGLQTDAGAVFGDPAIFQPREYEWAARANAADGSFRIGVRLKTERPESLLSFMWMAEAGPGRPEEAPAPKIVVTPGSSRLTFRQSVQFTAAATGLPQSDIVWSAREQDSGGITKNGFYVAPNTEGVFTICASSASKPGVEGIAYVIVKES